jgi:hypothetical protein
MKKRISKKEKIRLRRIDKKLNKKLINSKKKKLVLKLKKPSLLNSIN